jgi:hypothetical protein
MELLAILIFFFASLIAKKFLVNGYTGGVE